MHCGNCNTNQPEGIAFCSTCGNSMAGDMKKPMPAQAQPVQHVQHQQPVVMHQQCPHTAVTQDFTGKVSHFSYSFAVKLISNSVRHNSCDYIFPHRDLVLSCHDREALPPMPMLSGLIFIIRSFPGYILLIFQYASLRKLQYFST